VISVATAAALLRGEFRELYDQVLFVDCRYSFEFQGESFRSYLYTDSV